MAIAAKIDDQSFYFSRVGGLEPMHNYCLMENNNAVPVTAGRWNLGDSRQTEKAKSVRGNREENEYEGEERLTNRKDDAPER